MVVHLRHLNSNSSSNLKLRHHNHNHNRLCLNKSQWNNSLELKFLNLHSQFQFNTHPGLVQGILHQEEFRRMLFHLLHLLEPQWLRLHLRQPKLHLWPCPI